MLPDTAETEVMFVRVHNAGRSQMRAIRDDIDALVTARLRELVP